jgi:phosphoserine phosphatase RsbU/P
MTNHGGEKWDHDPAWRTLTDFTLSGVPGDEREAMERVAEAVQELRLSSTRLEGLKVAVAEAVLKAIEHGHHPRTELPVQIRIWVSDAQRAIAEGITDQDREAVPAPPASELQATLNDQQLPRGWGFFLIEKMVGDLHVASEAACHTVEVFVYREGDQRRDDNV